METNHTKFYFNLFRFDIFIVRCLGVTFFRTQYRYEIVSVTYNANFGTLWTKPNLVNVAYVHWLHK